MFVKLVTLAVCIASSLAAYNGPLAGGLPASLYPAGVSPQACPNFPNCENPAVAANPESPLKNNWAQTGWNGQPQQWNAQPQQSWNSPKPAWTQQPQWNNNGQQNNWNAGNQYGSDVQQRLDRGEYVGDGDYRGEGLAEALAPGYENTGGWNNNNNNNWNAGHQQAAPAWAPSTGIPASIPAGVDPRSCPNYPFCG